jgi:hypothetical protein
MTYKLALGLTWLGFAIVTVVAYAQAPEVTPGCRYATSLPTLTDKQRVVVQCDVNGRLIIGTR